MEAISKVLGDTTNGFSGSEIQALLKSCNINDLRPSVTKWKRLFEACNQNQILYKCGNHVCKLIQEAMDPVRYLKNKELWKQRQIQLNEILSLLGLIINESGKLAKTNQVFTIDQAKIKVNLLKEKLKERNTHSEIFKYCTNELVANNYFHAVFESCKGVAFRLKMFTKINKDGAELIDEAFSLKAPKVAINTLRTESEQSEHKGFANLLKGIFGMIRNPLAHDPKLNWNMSEQDALDIFAILSMVHRKMDIMVYIG